jgi:hypothetical protein
MYHGGLFGDIIETKGEIDMTNPYNHHLVTEKKRKELI